MITKLKPLGQCNALLKDVSLDGARIDSARLGGRRIITGMLTGPNGLLATSPPPIPARARRESPK